ncbi:MAG: restriction endonuclease subunit S, partial [Gammaproteobacteria bacterium]|nr:restriction endonuclease subunit S [Gammaproteobacteria bacterium]
MKVKTISNARLAHKGHRFDSKPFMSGVLEARVILDRLAVEKMPLCEVTKGHKGGIYNGPQFSRVYVDSPEHGVPFVGSSSMLMADLSNLPLLSKKHACSPGLSYLRLEEGMTLISCSGTVGRMVYVRPDMADIWSSQHIMKVVPDPDKTPPGYLYACLSGKFGVPQVVSGTYGAIIQHIEPEYMKDLSVPRLGEEVENAAENLMRQSIAGRERCNILLNRATSLLFDKIGMEDIRAFDWHSKGADISFVDKISHPQSFRALNFNPRYKALVTRL